MYRIFYHSLAMCIIIVQYLFRQIMIEYGAKYKLSFANGGDQSNDTIPEAELCEDLGISLIDNLGEKIQSSSWLLGQ